MIAGLLNEVGVCFLLFTSVLGQENEFKSWLETIATPNTRCKPTSLEKNRVFEKRYEPRLLFEASSECDLENDFRWDYSFFSQDKIGKNGIHGQGAIVFDRSYKGGLKSGLCVRSLRNDVNVIVGNFENNKLQGDFQIFFGDETFIKGFARDSVLVGLVRYFDGRSNLLNITSDNFNWFKNEYDDYEKFNNGSDPDYVTNDFKTIFTCDRSGSKGYVLNNCKEVNFNMTIKSKCEITIGGTETSKGERSFKWNLITKQRYYPGDKIFSDCNIEEWTSDKESRNGVKTWLKDIETIYPDYLWKMSPFEDPLASTDDPSLHIEVPEWNRNFLNGIVMIRTVDKTFGEAMMSEGKMSYKFRKEDIENHELESPIIIASKFGSAKAGLNVMISVNQSQVEDNIKESSLIIYGFLKRGKLHGIVRRYGILVTDPNTKCRDTVFRGLSFIGRYENGSPAGPSWRKVVGGGFLYGTTDGLEFTGNDLAFVYPDLETAIVGKFVKGLLIEGKEARVVGVRCVDGIMELKFSTPEGPTYHHKIPTSNTFGDQPQLLDPLDKKYVKIKSSGLNHSLASEGCFAARDIPAGTLIALYNGYLFTNEEIMEFNKKSIKDLDERKIDPNTDAYFNYMKYHASMKECECTITLPNEFASRENYNATSAHKFNHSFRPNCEFGGILDSPRFGIIRAFYTNRDISEGEELFISYGYSENGGPPWYRKMYADFFKNSSKPGRKMSVNLS